MHASAERLAALLKQREQLLRDVQKKKRELEQAALRAEQHGRAMVEKLGPLIAKHRELVERLRGLFDEVLAPGRLSASARKKVLKVRRALEAQGMLDVDEAGGADKDAEWAEWAESETASGAPHRGGGAPGRGSEREVDSAAQHGQRAGRESLRALFRRLVLKLHPDHARQDVERQQRTEAMKQVTQAYEEGDLARLLELERTWQTAETAVREGDDEARCRDLERTIRELRTQFHALKRELRALKDAAAPPFDAFGTSMSDVIAEAEGELEQLGFVCEFVQSFRDGKISLAEFIRGPDVEDVLDAEIDALVYEFLNETVSPATQRRKAPKKRPQRGKGVASPRNSARGRA